MPITRIFWSGNTGRDIHVLRGGFTRDLTHESLKFVQDDGTEHWADDYLVQVADVTLKFTPLFKGVPQGDDFVGNGITVNTMLGSVSVDPAASPKIKNFLIEVEAKNDGDGKIFNETIRIQIHNSVTQVWLTPDQLTVRPPLVKWLPKSGYYVGELFVDANHCLQDVTGLTAQITHVSITGNVLTLTVNQTFAVGGSVKITGLTGAAFLNTDADGEGLTIQSATRTQITAQFTHADYDADDAGNAVADFGSGLSGNGPGAPAFSATYGQTVTDNQLIWMSIGADWDLTTTYRFAVRAQFDDGIVGDLTDGHGVTWREPSDPSYHVDANSGALQILHSDNVGDKLFITATLPALLGGAATPLGPTLVIGRAWKDEPDPPSVEIVAGGGVPATGDMEGAPNILMLGDGFGDQDSFDQVVNKFVLFMRTNRLMRPYDLLSGSMYFWKAFLAADEIGISFRCEMAVGPLDDAGNTLLSPIPAVAKASPDPPLPKPPVAWKLPNLLYAVGLPVPGDDDPARTYAVLKAEWAEVLQVDPSPKATDDLLDQWKALAKRTFMEERDGFPGMSYGAPPAANQTDTTLLDLHQDRAGVPGLRALYRVMGNADVTLADGRLAGVTWAEPPNTQNNFHFDNTDLIAVISSYPGGRAQNKEGYIAISTKSDNASIPGQPVTGKNAFTLNMPAGPNIVEADASRTLAHEIGHSFGLGDEYAESGTPFNSQHLPNQHAEPSSANLQAETDTQVPDPNDPTKQIISGDEIQWTWHRIVAAAVVNGDITPQLDQGLDVFQIPVVPDVSFRFAQGDTLRLRPRTWGQPLRKFGSLEVSGDLVVTQTPTSDSVVVRAVSVISAQAFPAGSLLYAPKPAPASVLSMAYPYAEMVAKNIKDAITANKKPLTSDNYVFDPESPPQAPILDTSEGRTAVLNPFVGPVGSPRIVGLYPEGQLLSTGIFHPTGQCMMRQDHSDEAEFCAVCRYIMVDMINPAFHPEIDADYDKIYPQK